MWSHFCCCWGFHRPSCSCTLLGSDLQPMLSAEVSTRAQVDLQGDMYNLFMDRDGEPNQVRVGNVADLASINVKDIGGIPTQSLAEAVGARDAGMSGGKMMVFPDFPRKNATPDELQKYLMPPDAPAFPSKVHWSRPSHSSELFH